MLLVNIFFFSEILENLITNFIFLHFMDLLNKIKSKLEQALPGAVVTVKSESSQHRGHNVGGEHVGVIIAYPGFKDLPRVKQHQMIYKILDQEMKEEIHSLQITTKGD